MKKESSRWCPVARIEPESTLSDADAVHQEVAMLVKFLVCARANFSPVHAGDARQLALPSRSHRFIYLTCWKRRSWRGRYPCNTPNLCLQRRSTMPQYD